MPPSRLLEKELGKPSTIDGDRHVWAVVEGTDCIHLDLINQDDKLVGVGGGTVQKHLGDRFDRCAAQVGE